MTLAEEVRRFCSHHGLKLQTDLGQHFLVDADVLHDIVAAAHIAPGQRILEIGPGIGVLTRELLRAGASVTAIELDRRFLPLIEQFAPSSNLSPIHGNALAVPFPTEPYAIVANIPYHITSPLLRHAFLEGAHPPQSLTLLIQREVAEKICNTAHAGLLTIVVGLFGTPRIVRHVPPSAFLPPPAVDSSVLHIDCFPAPKADRGTVEEVLRLTKVGFAQKRKMLRNSIGCLPEGADRLARAGIDPMRRPETISVDEWILLARTRL